MQINPLSIQKYRGYCQMFQYTSGFYFDVLINETGFRIQRMGFDKPVHKSFIGTLFEDWLDNPVAFGMFENDALIGFIEGGQDELNHAFRITNLYVDETYRQHLIGTKLMEYMQKYVLLNFHYKRLILETQSCNYPAICFYQKQGYQLAGIHTLDYSNEDIEKKEVRFEFVKKIR